LGNEIGKEKIKKVGPLNDSRGSWKKREEKFPPPKGPKKGKAEGGNRVGGTTPRSVKDLQIIRPTERESKRRRATPALRLKEKKIVAKKVGGGRAGKNLWEAQSGLRGRST